ncbi:MAG: hypothetical protein SGI74_03935 [Oligoflexia bacterium]|nr:hypothetical protein [Oligoflexia bacterium]
MKPKTILSFLVLLISLSLAQSLQTVHADTAYDVNTPVKKKYKRALVVAGGGFQTAIFLGIIEGALKSPNPPDVIVATCGGSVAAAITNAFPNVEDRRKFLVEDYYESFRDVKLENNGFRYLIKSFFRVLGAAKSGVKEKIPPIFEDYMVNIPIDPKIMPKLNIPFNPQGIPIIIIAGELDPEFGPDHVGELRRGRKLVTQTFFTDPMTATLLEGFESPVAYPESTVRKETKTIIDKTLVQASRASISDFYGTSLQNIDGTFYVTGATDLYAIEVGEYVADEVIMTYKRPFPKMFQKAMKSVFRYDSNKRLKEVNAKDAAYWIDITDTNTTLAKEEFGPAINWLTWKVNLRMAKTFEEYDARVTKLWNYGEERAWEALNFSVRNWKCHVRERNKGNTDFNHPSVKSEPCPVKKQK